MSATISRKELGNITLEDFIKREENFMVELYTDYYFRPVLTIKESMRNLAFAECLQKSEIIERYYYEKFEPSYNNIVIIVKQQDIIDYLLARDRKEKRIEEEKISMLDIEAFTQVLEEYNQNPLKKLFNELYEVNDNSYKVTGLDEEFKYIK
ncbi:hypothetical protein HX049_18115 [Myroides odoratimimus]|uniref:hypothetical protein n=1 Tax=Myroides odoratimimus TaxID=76832 RepID=UPI00257889FC|nr:hypothetical protein [Myroides odoratimimus]MDM1399045.1 hypothetical protein [Myroides odoratimimus]